MYYRQQRPHHKTKSTGLKHDPLISVWGQGNAPWACHVLRLRLLNVQCISKTLQVFCTVRAGKMELSCPVGITCCVRKKNHFLVFFIPCNESSIDQACSVKVQPCYMVAPWAGKMNKILRFDWLPELARWSYLARSGLHTVSRKKNSPPKQYNKSFIDQVCSVKMAW